MFPCASSNSTTWSGCSSNPLASNRLIVTGSHERWHDFLICDGDEHHCIALVDALEHGPCGVNARIAFTSSDGAWICTPLEKH
jgi:hypothetical protein